MGLDSSIRRPMLPTIFSMIRPRWVSSTNLASVAMILPWRSTYTRWGPLTITSLTVGSLSRGSIGP